MGKDKLKRFAAIKTFANVHEPVMGEPFALKGKWRQEVFGNNNPIILELGCGKGEYAVGMGRHFAAQNFIGVEVGVARQHVMAVFFNLFEGVIEEHIGIGFHVYDTSRFQDLFIARRKNR